MCMSITFFLLCLCTSTRQLVEFLFQAMLWFRRGGPGPWMLFDRFWGWRTRPRMLLLGSLWQLIMIKYLPDTSTKAFVPPCLFCEPLPFPFLFLS